MFRKTAPSACWTDVRCIVQFFLRGTQLHQLTEEYEAIQANVEQMDDALRRKKQILPELREAYIKAKERAREATAAINQQEKLESLKEELVWSYVDENEEAVRAGQGHVETEKGKIIQTEEQIKKYEVRFLSEPDVCSFGPMSIPLQTCRPRRTKPKSIFEIWKMLRRSRPTT